ncbi:uncharacterized protein PHACADRAFT_197551 [Phanerochaete carnosa HHB-10118-sp]|uniref:AB hydrolase-1 domain-containing protein n=1 Tax=Phanerochaete carnosa (strain HHB-10118-sp) TaxID=650164 RepID=K5VNR5_PHACS|nr:uncharacterized protein PHACADRAFT_197551 [Phanerochaete carnosa HHB-10118-sp]EKM53123.1 hypothetical protein PHACADRAFT_197551 [Phanerochaete carnosa HHB-10118-sp]
MSQTKLISSADDTRIYANAIGNASNPVLVFIHGFSADSTVFNDIFHSAKNSTSFYLVRYDLRGAGRSGKLTTVEGYASKKFAEDFAAVMSAFQLQKPITGWSMGAIVVNDVLSHLPVGTLTGAVCIAASPCTTPKIIASFNPIVRPTRLGLFSTDVAIAERANLALVRILFLRDSSPSESFKGNTMRALEQGSDFREDNPVVTWETRSLVLGASCLTPVAQKKLLATREHDTTAALAAMREGFPLLAIVGSKDAMVNAQKFSDALKEVCTNVQVEVVADGSHAAFLDAPDQVMSWIFKFAERFN